MGRKTILIGDSTMKRTCSAFLLSILTSAVLAQDVVQEGSADFPMSPDSIKGEVALLEEPQTDRTDPLILNVQSSDKFGVIKSVAPTQIRPEVFLMPYGEIKTSYSGRAENDAIFLLRRAINLTQLQYKSENEYAPVSAQQTVDRVQYFLAQYVQSKLIDCGVGSDLPSDEPKDKNVVNTPQATDYLYKVELGVSRLVISKTLFSTSLTGEAEARIIENNQLSKKIQVDSFGGGKAVLEKFGTESVESDAELKAATSKLVDYLANKLGDKLCRYFN